MSDSAAKRKAAGPPDTEGGSRSAKRQKIPADETPESTTTKGLEFIEAIRKAKDKTGRGIIDEFLTLPDPKQIPGYYEQIRLPIAIDTIEEKLHNQEYQNMTGVESDLKRLVQNAKDFNDKRSLIYEDAERVRKTASNWFVKNNPAYNDSNYVAKPTPIPGDSNGTPITPTPITLKLTNRSALPRAKAKSHTPQPPAKAVEEPEKEEEEEEETFGGLSDFTGKTFQQAQEHMVEELINYEEAGLQIFQPFQFLPPRTLADYYSLIKYPVSLKSIQKKVRGQHGRGPATGVSDFQSWDALAEEMDYIWRNAREYNEDGSDIFLLAGELEELFKERLALARSQVEQPTQPKIKLNLGSNAPKQSIKLKFGASKASPGAQSPGSTPGVERGGQSGVIVDNESLRRQREMVSAGMNGGRPMSAAGRNPFSGSRSGSASTPVPAINANTSVASPPAQTNGVKAESQHGQSPALSAIRPTTTASGPLSMPPPAGVASRPMSGSPHPQLQAPLYPTSTSNQYQPPQYHPPNGFVESRNRPKGQTAADSILPTLTITSHPGLNVSKPFKKTISAHPQLTQQSFTFTVPATMHYFQIIPNLPASVTQRAYRIFVMVNGQRLSEYIKPGEERDKTHPVFEARLERGSVGRIEVEVLAGKGTIGKSGKEEVEWEKCTVFIHVMRN